MIGIRSLRASSTARCSFLVSTIHTADGVRLISRSGGAAPEGVVAGAEPLADWERELLAGDAEKAAETATSADAEAASEATGASSEGADATEAAAAAEAPATDDATA